MTEPRDLKTVVILNAGAGGGSMLECFRRIEHRLFDLFGDFELHYTEARCHAIELTRQALRNGGRRILAGGGDGTVNEVVNGFFGEDGKLISPEAILGLLPGGTGGDLRKTLGIADEVSALQALASGKTMTTDVGLLSYRDDEGMPAKRYFVNIASFGFSGSVDRFVENFNNLPGQWAYLAATARAMFDYTTPTVNLSIDEHFEAYAPISTVAVANGKFFGGGMKVAPGALVNDGLFNVTVLGAMTRLELLGLARTIYDGQHLEEGKVLSLEGRVVEATSDEEVPLDVDGEALGWLPAKFEIIPRVLNVCVGEVLQ